MFWGQKHTSLPILAYVGPIGPDIGQKHIFGDNSKTITHRVIKLSSLCSLCRGLTLNRWLFFCQANSFVAMTNCILMDLETMHFNGDCWVTLKNFTINVIKTSITSKLLAMLCSKRLKRCPRPLTTICTWSRVIATLGCEAMANLRFWAFGWPWPWPLI